MAASTLANTQYTPSDYVESCGAILFKVSTREICLVHSHDRNEWLLPKGRRNIGETRQQGAIREVQEETGFPSRLLPINLESRCTPNVEEEIGFTPDKPRLFEGVIEPFELTHRILRRDQGMKLIWWYIAAINEDKSLLKGEPDLYSSKLFGFEEAIAALTFAADRKTVERAIEIYKETYGDAC